MRRDTMTLEGIEQAYSIHQEVEIYSTGKGFQAWSKPGWYRAWIIAIDERHVEFYLPTEPETGPDGMHVQMVMADIEQGHVRQSWPAISSIRTPFHPQGSYIVYEERQYYCLILKRCHVWHDAKLMWSFFAGSYVPRMVYVGDGDPRQLKYFPGQG